MPQAAWHFVVGEEEGEDDCNGSVDGTAVGVSSGALNWLNIFPKLFAMF